VHAKKKNGNVTNDWIPKISGEIKYYAAYIIAGQLKKNSVQLYWTKWHTYNMPVFSEEISLK
jgi:hypothetical protein